MSGYANETLTYYVSFSSEEELRYIRKKSYNRGKPAPVKRQYCSRSLIARAYHRRRRQLLDAISDR